MPLRSCFWRQPSAGLRRIALVMAFSAGMAVVLVVVGTARVEAQVGGRWAWSPATVAPRRALRWRAAACSLRSVLPVLSPECGFYCLTSVATETWGQSIPLKIRITVCVY